MAIRITLATIAIALLTMPIVLAVQRSVAQTASPPAIVGSQAAQIVADPDAGTVDIIIQGRPVARFDAVGLHVQGDLEYGGNLTDTGGAAEGKP